MSDTPASTPAPDPVPVLVIPSAPVPALKPGIYSSEAWLTLLTNLVGLIPASGLVANMPLAAKLVGMAIAALATLNYTAQRTSLKRAHLAATSIASAGGGGYVPATSIPSSSVVGKLAMATLALGAAGLVAWGCSGAAATVAKDVTAGGNAFLQCEGVSLSQLVTDKDGKATTLLAAVSNDLVSADYLQLISDLIGVKGANVVGCAVLAVDTVVEAGKTSGAAALSPIEARARELINKYGWKLAPPATSPASSTPPVKAALSAPQHRAGLAARL